MKIDHQPVSEGRGNAAECYAARLDESAAGRITWCRVDGKRESLLVREADATTWTADQETYIAGHCFAGGELFWSRMDEPRAWSLRTRNSVVPTRGRAMALSAHGVSLSGRIARAEVRRFACCAWLTVAPATRWR